MIQCEIKEYGYNMEAKEFYAGTDKVKVHIRSDMHNLFCEECRQENICNRKNLIGDLLDSNGKDATKDQSKQLNIPYNDKGGEQD